MSEKRGEVIIVLILLSSFCYPYEISGESTEISLIRPDSKYIDWGYVPEEYLSSEDLIFLTCLEEPNIEPMTSILCEDDISFSDITMMKWTNNCYIGSFDLSEKDCMNMVIQSEYTKDDETVELRKRIKVNRLSSIIDYTVDTQYSDGGWKDSVQTAAGIWVLSHFEDIYEDEIDSAIDWLKLNRDNDDKCWPDEDCSVTTTAKILAFLTMANLNETRRIVHDSLVFLMNKQNYFEEEEEWTVGIRPIEGAMNCIINYNGTDLIEWNLTINSTYSFNFEVQSDSILDIVCDRNFRSNLTTPRSERVYLYEGDNMTYTIPKPCWNKDTKWGDCDVLTTEYALLSHLPDAYRDRGLEYLGTEVRRHLGNLYYVGPLQNITESALYLMLQNNSNVVSFLRYKQNNNGSWGRQGSHEDILYTGYSIMGLLATGFNRTDEVIEDAERWVSERELEFATNVTSDYIGWNNTEKNAMGFIVLKNNQRPMIKANPQVIIMDKDKIDIEITNPTTFNLEELSYNLSTNLEPVVGIEVKEELSAYSYTILHLTRKSLQNENLYGYLSISNLGDETARIPIVVLNAPKIELSVKKGQIIVFGTNAKFEFSLTKTGHTFNCKLGFDDGSDFTSKTDFVVNSNELSVDITFTKSERSEKKYKGKFTCEAGGETFQLPFEIEVSRYSSFPFSFTPTDIVINETGRDRILTIKNKLDETLDIKLGFSKPDDSLSLSETDISIDPSDEYNISILNRFKSGENITKKTQLEITAIGEQKTVEILVDIVAETKESMNPIVLWVIIIVIFTSIGALGFVGYRFWPDIKKRLSGSGKVDVLKIKIRKLEEKEKNTAIMNMVKIMRFMKKEDSAIKARLREEGFIDAEIDKAIEESEKEDSEKAKEAAKK